MSWCMLCFEGFIDCWNVLTFQFAYFLKLDPDLLQLKRLESTIADNEDLDDDIFESPNPKKSDLSRHTENLKAFKIYI